MARREVGGGLEGIRRGSGGGPEGVRGGQTKLIIPQHSMSSTMAGSSCGGASRWLPLRGYALSSPVIGSPARAPTGPSRPPSREGSPTDHPSSREGGVNAF
eukprot:1182607-Prorocentrum_minimum.AAC.1